MLKKVVLVAVGVAIATMGIGPSAAQASADVYSMFCTPHSGGGSCIEVYTDANNVTTMHSYWYDNHGNWGQNW